MKRGKDDEKIMEPMFPRLHVNDTDKGGPRAPPRNKMALYEQLTIPSQRYNSASAPPRQNNTSNLVPSTSTSQGTSGKRKAYFPLYQPPSTPAYEEIQDLNAEAINLNNQPIHVEEKKKSLEEDDFMVPIFSQGRTELHNENIQNSNDREGRLCLNSNNQTALPTTICKETNQSHDDHLVLNQLIKDRDGRDSRVSPSTRISLDISMSGRNGMPWPKGVSLPEDHRGNSRAVDCRSSEDVPDLRVENSCKDTSLRLRLDPQTGCGFRGDDEINRGIDSLNHDGYVDKESIDKGDDVSETSMVDSASEFDISPDDVVDIIGRKHFWKARTAIVNQQRVFAVQVFELHRLLKVQKLIAGSPNLLLEVSAFEGKSPLKGSSVKYSSEYVVKALPHKAILKDVAHRTIDKVEGTAENAVPKASPTPIAPQQHPNLPAGYPSFSGNMDPKVNPWGFHQPSPHQWLVPVMTPSEGLVYKPYPAPGFMGPVCGGYGPVGPTSIPSNLMNPPYVAQTQQYQQPMGMPPGVHFGGPGYFPPYGMHMMGPSMSGSTVDQVNPSFGSNPYSQGGQPESSPATRFGAPMPASAPTSDRATAPLSEGRDGRRLFRSPPTSEAPMDTPPVEKQARVIRAVPHRSTNDSAARIFQSIQQERQLYESR
ncbi:protein EARLY FLOWERING 3-like [Silene latifolia]|uniref:protein EARLY FLOWERING 3-like n=1 Tax=Silene latifolia TaxID=37657 RepID=UPI003D7867D9